MSQESVVVSEITSVLHQFEEKPDNVEILNETDDELSWLNSEYIGNVLHNYYVDSTIVVEKMLLRPCSAKGDQYASTMYRLLVHFRSVKMVRHFLKRSYNLEGAFHKRHPCFRGVGVWSIILDKSIQMGENEKGQNTKFF